MRLHIEDKQKANGNLQVDCTEYVKDKYQRKSRGIYQKIFFGKRPFASDDDSDSFDWIWIWLLGYIWLNIFPSQRPEAQTMSLCLSCPEEANRMEVLWYYPPSKAPPAQNVFNFSILIFTSDVFYFSSVVFWTVLQDFLNVVQGFPALFTTLKSWGAELTRTKWFKYFS